MVGGMVPATQHCIDDSICKAGLGGVATNQYLTLAATATTTALFLILVNNDFLRGLTQCHRPNN